MKLSRSPRWLQIVRADERLKTAFPQITLPLLIIRGSADKAAKPSGSRHFYDHAGSKDRTLKLYEGRYHDPLSDLGKEGCLPTSSPGSKQACQPNLSPLTLRCPIIRHTRRQSADTPVWNRKTPSDQRQ